MGVKIGDLLDKKEVEFASLKGKRVAIDAHNAIYQFLSTIRQPDGTPLKDSHDRITSHLSGLLYRTVNLIEAGIKPIYVFDGKSPTLKVGEMESRAAIREEARKRWEEAETQEEAFKYAQASSSVTSEMIEESKSLLGYMGIPFVQAPSEGEAQAAHLIISGDADYVGSQDYDSLLFGAPRLARNLTIAGKRKLPGRDEYKLIKPEIIELGSLDITREQLVELGILIGTDFNAGIRGIGPKKALELIKKHHDIERVLEATGEKIGNLDQVKRIFLQPNVTSEYEITSEKPSDRLKQFLCEEHDFSPDRVDKALDRLIEASDFGQKTLDQWL